MTARGIEVPRLVLERAFAAGDVGRRWLEDLDDVVADLRRLWGPELSAVYQAGTAGYVVAGRDQSSRDVALKVAMPLDADEVAGFLRSVTVHRFADGRGCARLLAHDTTRSAMLLERLGPNLDELGHPVDGLLRVVATTLRSFWRPADRRVDLPTGADKAVWLAGVIVATWEQLGRPCPQAVIDRAVSYCDERAAAFDWSRAVLVHGDAHGWNTVSSGDGGYKFVDPEGVWSEPVRSGKCRRDAAVNRGCPPRTAVVHRTCRGSHGPDSQRQVGGPLRAARPATTRRSRTRSRCVLVRRLRTVLAIALSWHAVRLLMRVMRPPTGSKLMCTGR